MADQFDHRDDFEKMFDHTYLRWFDLEGQPALEHTGRALQQESQRT